MPTMEMSSRFRKVTSVKLPSITASLIPVRYCLSGSTLGGILGGLASSPCSFSAKEVEEVDAMLYEKGISNSISTKN